jgi:hypothetical protein
MAASAAEVCFASLYRWYCPICATMSPALTGYGFLSTTTLSTGPD